MAAQQREKEETELKVPESIPLCSQTLPVPAPPPPPPPPHTAVTRSPEISDLNLSSSNESRSSSGNLPEMIDLKFFSTDESRSSSGRTPERIDLKHSGKYKSRFKLSGSSSERIDLNLSGTNESRFSSGISPESIDLKFAGINESRFSSDSIDLISGTNESRSSSGSSIDLKFTDELISSSGSLIDLKLLDTVELRSTSAISPENSQKSGVKREREVNRCSGIGCRRKVGLMSFRCRCGELFCSEHRYSDRHDCSYDYKAAGREAIARENPVVKAAKILKV